MLKSLCIALVLLWATFTFSQNSFEEISLDNKITDLLSLIRGHSYCLNGKFKRSSIALEHYNNLCKLLHKDSAKTITDIDNVWLEDLEYKQWKKKKLQEFADKELEPIEQQELIRHILFFKLDQTNKNTNYDSLIFRWFNLLRELTGESPIISPSYECKDSPLEAEYYEWLINEAINIIKTIHQNQVYRERAYIVWRDLISNEPGMQGTTSYNLILFCVKEVSRSLEQSAHDRTTSYLIHACDMYNILREIFKLEKIQDEAGIDTEWLDRVSHETTRLKDKADTEDLAAHLEYRRDMIQPDSIQQALLEHTKKVARVEEDILLLSSNQKLTGFAGKSIVGVNNFPDLDYQLFIVYHELGHIFYKDTKTHESIENLEISVFEILESDAFKVVETTAERYINKAKLVLEPSSAVGKQLKHLLNSTTTFWIPTVNEGEIYANQLLGRTMEKRADLFALEKLYEQNKINAIILWIYNLAFGLLRDNKPYIVVKSDDPHPSDIERALYAIGFLAEKGLDLSEALKQWEEQGTCQPVENILQEVAIPEKTGIEINETQSSLHEVFINKAHYSYELWKKETYGNLSSQAITSDLKLFFSILQSALEALNQYQESPCEYSRTLALNFYNFLRELTQEEQVISSYAIDKVWMRNLYGQIWSKLCIQEYKEMHYTQEEQLRDLTLRILSDLAFFHYEPEAEPKILFSNDFSGRPFYSKRLFDAWSAYNSLRKLLGKSPANYPDYEIDYAWLQNLGFQYWKADILKFFSQQNFTFAQQVEFCIRSYLTGVETTLGHFEIQTPLPSYAHKIGSVLNFNVTHRENFIKELLDKSTAKGFSFIYSYNFTRELFDKPKADTEEDIDHRWILERFIQNQSVSCGQPHSFLAVAEQPIPKGQQLEIEKLAVQAIRGLKPFDSQKPKKLNDQSLKDLADGWCAYSLLETVLGTNKVKLADYRIDYAWLKDFSFQLWKKRVETLFTEEEQQLDLTFKDRIKRLIVLQIFPFSDVFEVNCVFSKFFPSLSPGECYFVDKNYGMSLNALYGYNLLREYFKESKAEVIEHTDGNWMIEVCELDHSKLIAYL